MEGSQKVICSLYFVNNCWIQSQASPSMIRITQLSKVDVYLRIRTRDRLGGDKGKEVKVDMEQSGRITR